MRSLVEIVRVLGQYQNHKALQTLGISQDPKTQIGKFYFGIKSGKFTTDEDAAKAILNSSGGAQDYRSLKAKVRNRLLNLVFFISPNKLKVDQEYNKIAIHCHKRWMAAKILHVIGAENTAAKLAAQVLRQAEKIKLSYLIVDIARYLRFHHGLLTGDEEKSDHYNKLYHKYRQIEFLDDKAQEYYIQLALFYARSRAEKSEIHEQAKAFYSEVEPHISKYKTYKLIYFGGLIKLITYMSINDYQTSMQICEEVLEELNKDPLFPTSGKITFNMQQLTCCIQLKQFSKGESISKAALKLLIPGIHNWFVHQDLYFLLCMHTKNYHRAYEVIQETQNINGFNSLNENKQEVWRIYKIYVNYLIVKGKIEVAGQPPRIRLAKFLNEVPQYSRDKRGLNIAILIIQILLYIHRKNYDAAIDRIEALERYCSRYLLRDKDFRSNCFIKMLLKIPRANFHPIAAERHAKELKEKLIEKPLNIANQAHSIEIIPYEDLWEIAIASLDKKLKKHQF